MEVVKVVEENQGPALVCSVGKELPDGRESKLSMFSEGNVCCEAGRCAGGKYEGMEYCDMMDVADDFL